jgi:hypothetical protein
MRIWIDMVTRKDARLLCRWWNGHTCGRFSIRRSETNRRFWAVVKES